MKKIIALLLSLCSFVLVFFAVACNEKPNGDNTDVPPVIKPEEPKIEKSGNIVVIGDSLMDFWDNGETFLSDYFDTASNKAILATHVYDWFSADRNYSKILESNPTDVLIGLGINDIKANGDITLCTDYLKNLFVNLKKDNPDLTIHYVSVNKCYVADFWVNGIEQWNDIMQTYCNENGHYFIDTQDAFLADDGGYDLSLFIEDKLHFSSAGYAVLESVFEEHFNSYKSAE